MTVQEDLDYVDDIGLPSSTQHGAQQNAERLRKTANSIVFKVNTWKTQVLGKNTRVNEPLMIEAKHLLDVE